MAHAPSITARLPGLYAQGELLRQVVDHPALAMEILDEDLLEVRRAHWFESALELDEAARLAAVLDISPEPWQDLAMFRAWVHALRTAILAHGTTGVRALQVFVEEYLRRLSMAARVPRLFLRMPGSAGDWLTRPADAPPVDRTSLAGFVENPLRLVTSELGPLVPLARFTVRNGGLDPTPLGALLVGLPAGPEYVPVLANVTTGEAVAYLGAVVPGQRLWLRADGTARLEHRDATERVRGITRLTPGTPWSPADVESPPRALRLVPGDNELWFLPVAHYDSPGLDRVLLALATLELRPGVYDQANFDAALFAQDPAVRVSLAWRQAAPATVDVTLPAGLLLSVDGGTDAALAVREQTGLALDTGVDSLAAAGVVTRVALSVFAETQPQRDYLTGRIPLRIAERGPTGADRLPDSGGLFDVTSFEDSTFD